MCDNLDNYPKSDTIYQKFLQRLKRFVLKTYLNVKLMSFCVQNTAKMVSLNARNV